jgi:hypothetical protein
MAFGVGTGAALARSRLSFGEPTESPSIDPSALPLAGDAVEPRAFRELDCVRQLLAADVIEAAEQRAAALGTGADRVLIAAGTLGEEAYLRALGVSLGVAFEPLDGVARALCPLGDERLIEAVAQGMLPLVIDGELCLVVAPRAAAARRIAELIAANPGQARHFRFTSAERLSRFAMRCAGKTIVARASKGLKQNWPALSAAPPRWRGHVVALTIAAMAALAAATLATAATMYAIEIMLAAIFLAWLGLRLAGALVDWIARKPAADLPDDQLPTYTVIAALYREAASVDALLSAIERLDYPGIMAQTPQAIRPAVA